MNEKYCAFCGNKVPQIAGKKERKFCNATCRQKKWQQDQRELRHRRVDEHPKEFPQIACAVKKEIVDKSVTVSQQKEMPRGLSLEQRIIWEEEHGSAVSPKKEQSAFDKARLAAKTGKKDNI